MIKEISNIVTGLLRFQVNHILGRLEEVQTRVIRRAALFLTAVLLLTGGVGMIIYSIHTLLVTILPPAASALIIGLILILSAMIVLSVAGQKSKD